MSSSKRKRTKTSSAPPPPVPMSSSLSTEAEAPKDLTTQLHELLPEELTEIIKEYAEPYSPWLVNYKDGPFGCALPDRIQIFSITRKQRASIDTRPWYKFHKGLYKKLTFHAPCIGYILLSCWTEEENSRRFSIMDEDDHALINPVTNDIFKAPDLDLEDSRSLSASLNAGIMCATIELPDDQCTTAVLRGPANQEGRPEWMYVEENFSTICCIGNCLYCTSEQTNTVAYDLNSGEKLFTIEPPDYERDQTVISKGFYSFYIIRETFLVEVRRQLIRVVRHLINSDLSIEQSGFKLYKLVKRVKAGGEGNDTGAEIQHYWEEIQNLEDRAIFLDLTRGFSSTAVNGIEADCIYFITKDRKAAWKYNISTKTFHKLDCPFRSCSWFVPTPTDSHCSFLSTRDTKLPLPPENVNN